MRLGFIGLGVMGEPMCVNLIKKSGESVFGFDLNPAPCSRLKDIGLQVCGKPGDVAAEAEIIFLSLPSIAEVEKVSFDFLGMSASNRKVRLIVDMSTSHVGRTRDLADKMRTRDIEFLDAPVARMRQAARDGTLSIMVGGERDAFEEVLPYLTCMGSDITHCGVTGTGQIAKILNNMVVFMTVHALAEALTIGRKAGIDGKILFDVMSKGSADSFALRSPGLKSLVPNAFPENTFPTDYAIKDISLALNMADQYGLEVESAALTKKILQRASKEGFSKNYYPVIIKMIERGMIEL